MSSLKDRIKDAAPKPVALEVPGWGQVFVKMPTLRMGKEFSDYQKGHDTIEVLAFLAKSIVCDADGNLEFTDEDMDFLMDQELVSLMAISKKFIELSNVKVDEAEKK